MQKTRTATHGSETLPANWPLTFPIVLAGIVPMPRLAQCRIKHLIRRLAFRVGEIVTRVRIDGAQMVAHAV